MTVLDYRQCPVTDRDYADLGLTAAGIKRARDIEPRIRELLAEVVEDRAGATPHDVTSFLQTCIRAVGHSRDAQVRWNRVQSQVEGA